MKDSLIRIAERLEPEALAQRSGNRNFNGPRQILAPPPIVLCTNSGAGESTFSTMVRVPTPDSRCRVKLSVSFVPANGANVADITGPTTLWIAGCDYDQGGTGGGGGRTIPVTNVEGTKAAPTPIPSAAGLLGYSREFVTAADCLEAVFTTGSLTGPKGAWMMQTRIQPDAVTLDWKEWDEIRRLFLPFNVGGQGSV